MNENLCQRYRALTPFMVRREKVGEVFLLINRINQRNDREKGIKKQDTRWTDKQGNLHIRRKATDDSWW